MINALLAYLAGLDDPLLPWRDQAPETASYPLAVITSVAEVADRSALSEGGATELTVQIDCYGKTVATVDALANKYIAALDLPGEPPTPTGGWDCLYCRLDTIDLSSEQESDGSDARIYRVMMQYVIVAEQSAVNQ